MISESISSDIICIIPSLLAVWVEEVSQWPKESNKWLLHFEQVTIDDDEGKDPSSPRTKKQMCRAENFVNFHEKLGALCRGLLQDVSSQLFEEEAVLFKEKVSDPTRIYT